MILIKRWLFLNLLTQNLYQNDRKRILRNSIGLVFVLNAEAMSFNQNSAFINRKCEKHAKTK